MSGITALAACVRARTDCCVTYIDVRRGLEGSGERRGAEWRAVHVARNQRKMARRGFSAFISTSVSDFGSVAQNLRNMRRLDAQPNHVLGRHLLHPVGCLGAKVNEGSSVLDKSISATKESQQLKPTCDRPRTARKVSVLSLLPSTPSREAYGPKHPENHYKSRSRRGRFWRMHANKQEKATFDGAAPCRTAMPLGST